MFLLSRLSLDLYFADFRKFPWRAPLIARPDLGDNMIEQEWICSVSYVYKICTSQLVLVFVTSEMITLVKSESVNYVNTNSMLDDLVLDELDALLEADGYNFGASAFGTL